VHPLLRIAAYRIGVLIVLVSGPLLAGLAV
jgi:hypothetical protein